MATASRQDVLGTAPLTAELIEVSVVMPCLNEADTIGACVVQARRTLEASGIVAEIIVADNGSTDGSPTIAAGCGARVVHVSERGYGSALMGGIEAACGRYVIMGDADQSYDFGEIPRFVEKLRQGYALVQGCRLPSGGGRVMPGAMPTSHRWLGNPLFSFLGRVWFNTPVHDIYCGMRGFTSDLYKRLDQRCMGMEFATEMIIKASLYGERIAEVPITLHPDGRKSHPPHLRTLRDGWRTLRFFLLYTPRWLFLLPGALLLLLGAFGYALAMPGVTIGGVTFDVHSLLFASVAILAGQQAISFGLLSKSFADREGLLPLDDRTERFFQLATLERGIALGLLLILLGPALLGAAVVQWWRVGFGALDYPSTMRWVIPGATLTLMGFHTIWVSFFASVLGLRRR